jgi:hypothetical protein
VRVFPILKKMQFPMKNKFTLRNLKTDSKYIQVEIYNRRETKQMNNSNEIEQDW